MIWGTPTVRLFVWMRNSGVFCEGSTQRFKSCYTFWASICLMSIHNCHIWIISWLSCNLTSRLIELSVL
jgi:hypothetical protein